MYADIKIEVDGNIVAMFSCIVSKLFWNDFVQYVEPSYKEECFKYYIDGMQITREEMIEACLK